MRHEKSVVDLYVHENVPGIADSGVEYAELVMIGEQERMAPRITRYRIPFNIWSEWTTEETIPPATIIGGSGAQGVAHAGWRRSPRTDS